ncbi:hypothetical protein AKJ48_04185 [candidate division MSBL1 archaeon SCGC-AAA261O19]|uniref:Uncharacterized protein n=1 Tax=candidate division MSBL1 archaeon SCGC-AAA261O19 TaxID=1698277 RepID=A0A133V9M6_9EURY|nr:hypothetical protein AKJ48_04185 [candidate division MSBL1 archaeon SCGC-AAA261O19]
MISGPSLPVKSHTTNHHNSFKNTRERKQKEIGKISYFELLIYQTDGKGHGPTGSRMKENFEMNFEIELRE